MNQSGESCVDDRAIWKDYIDGQEFEHLVVVCSGNSLHCIRPHVSGGRQSGKFPAYYRSRGGGCGLSNLDRCGCGDIFQVLFLASL